MDDVFRALADPTRRSLLDELFKEDGQTLSALEERLPMTRFGVMKHLKVLEDAGLVVTKRRGREKLHFLNPIPIRLVHDRWVSKYAEPWAAGLSGLKQELEHDMEPKPMAKVSSDCSPTCWVTSASPSRTLPTPISTVLPRNSIIRSSKG